jgi:hypothetical protein
MYAFTSLSSWTTIVKGERLHGFGVGCPVVSDRDKVREAIGQYVMIDGVVWQLVGVERNLPNRPMAIDEPIGLVVRNVAHGDRPETAFFAATSQQSGGAA